MRKSFIHEYDVRVAMRDNSDGFRAGQFEVRALAAGKHNPCSDFLKYEVAAVQYEPVFAVLELREHGGVSSDDSRRSGISDWSVEEVFRTEYGVEIFTFRCLVTGQTTTGERWHRMDSVSVGGRAYADGNAAETALEEVKLAETLEIRKHLIREELALSVEFSFDFPDECTSEVEWHSWVLYDLRDFTVLHAADLNGALAPGIAYSERSSERCGMSTSKHTHLSTISHGAGTAVASPKKFEALRNEFLAPKGEKIEFGDFFRGAPREENRQVLVVNGLIWNGKDRHLDVYVISCKSAGSGRNSYHLYELMLPDGATWEVFCRDEAEQLYGAAAPRAATSSGDEGPFGCLKGLKFD